MSQHLEDRVLTDLAFDLLDAKEAAPAKRHLQGCKTCKARQKKLRATLAQLDATRADFKASEDLIARTLRAARGEKVAEPLIATPPAENAKAKKTAVAKPRPPALESAPPPQPSQLQEQEIKAGPEVPPDNILDLPPRRSVLELQRFFWLAAAAALTVAGGVWLTTFGLKDSETTVASAPSAAEIPANETFARPQEEKRFRQQQKRDASGLKSATADTSAPDTSDYRADKLRTAEPRESTAAAVAEPPENAVAPVPKLLAMSATRASVEPPPAATAPAAAPDATSRTKTEMTKSMIAAAPVVAPVPARPAPVALGGALAKSEGAPASPASNRRSSFSDDIEFTVQTIQFMLPMTSGTWVLQQNVNVRASVGEDETRLYIANHGVLPVVFQLLQRRTTNVLDQFELDSGATTNLIRRTR